MTNPEKTGLAVSHCAQPSVLERRGWDWGMLTLLLATLAVVGGGGLAYLDKLDTAARNEAESKLAAVAQLKIRELTQWRKERLQDATYVRRTPYVLRRALDTLANPHSGATRRMFTGWLDAMLANHEYNQALLLDTNLNVRLTHPAKPPAPVPEALRQTAAEALRTRRVVIADLYRATDDGPVRLALVVPLVVRREGTKDNVPAAGTGDQSSDRTAAVLVLTVDPETFLYPLIQRWPAPSPSAETLLVRREGEQVVYLNELRHRKDTALRLRARVSSPDLPAAMAARGRRGAVQGVAYRGVPVLATLSAVPDTPWLMVAQVDQEEVFATFRRQARMVWGEMALLTLASGLGVALLARRRRVRSLRRQLLIEQEKRVLAERVELLMHEANDIIVLTDEQWRILEVNARAEEAYGYSREELLRMTLRDLRAPEAREDFERQTRTLTAGTSAVFETVHQRKNGTTFPIETSDKAITIGGVRYGIAFIRDITERKAREGEIDRLNRLYATMSEINQTIVRVKSRDELFREVCRVAVEYGGFKLAWVGRQGSETQVMTPMASAGEPQDLVTRLLKVTGLGNGDSCLCCHAMRGGRPEIDNDLRQSKAGQPWQTEVLKAGLLSAAVFPIQLDGKIWGGFAVYAAEAQVFQDREVAMLTEVAGDIAFGLDALEREQRREEAENALRESEEKHRLLVQAAREAIFVVQDGEIQFGNRAAARMAGLSESEMVGRCLLDFVPEEDRALIREDLTALLAGDRTEIQKEYRALNAEGNRLLLAVNAVRMNWKGSPAALCLAADITRQRQLEAQLRQSQKMEAVGQLAGGVAHDFNNLLAVIRGNAELLLMDRQDLGSPTHECLTHIAGAAERAAGLTRQLLIFSRKQVMQPQPVALNTLIGNLTKMLRRVIREDISLDCVYGEPLPSVQADPGMMEQVVLNLVVNARDAMPGGGKLRIQTDRVTLDAASVRPGSEARPGEFVCLGVQDTGVGIAPEILPRIFEPFFTTKDAAKGTGLGLATVYGIVKQHQGWIEVSSRPGEGALFRIFLPAVASQPEPKVEAPAEVAQRGGGETILLVEDDYSVRMITPPVLESYNYRVHEAASAREALGVWKQRAPEIALLLTDIIMPDGITGRDLAEQLRAERPNLKLIFISGYSADVVGQNTQFFRRTNSHFLQKPCPADVLVRTVRETLDEP